ncbi:hypothetical protein P7K49_030416, partial [Saguinus oedipus]
MSREVRDGAGLARGCGALRSGRRRQKRAARGQLVGAARSWALDWLLHSRVRRLLGSGRAPRPRARRPLTARYVLARRLRLRSRFLGLVAAAAAASRRVPGERRWRRPGAGRSEHLPRPSRRRWVSAPPAPCRCAWLLGPPSPLPAEPSAEHLLLLAVLPGAGTLPRTSLWVRRRCRPGGAAPLLLVPQAKTPS